MKKTHIITDPIHQVINLGSNPKRKKLLKSILDTKEFQRLRRITQLGLASYVFPGATHTRFSHCLGAAYLAYSLLSHLLEWAEEKEVRDEIEDFFDEVIVAALLHDLGHGPFSHCFEQILKDYRWAPKHEAWGASLIKSHSSGIYKALMEHNIDVESVASVLTKSEQTRLKRPYQEIVSSQIDVDRMDYLLRDSHFAGVAIGQFDVQYLINSMVIINHGCGDPPRSLGLTPKGVKAYEAFLLARQLMNRTVYYHHKTKVLEFMMERILGLIINKLHIFAKDKNVFPVIPPYFWKVHQAIASQPETPEEFMKCSLDGYFKLTEDAVWVLISAIAESSEVPLARNLANRLLTRDLLEYRQVEAGKDKVLREALLNAKLKESVDFQLSELKTTMYKDNGDEGVFVLDWDNKTIRTVVKHSDTISAFRDRPEAEFILIAIDDDKRKCAEIMKIAEEGGFARPLATA